MCKVPEPMLQWVALFQGMCSIYQQYLFHFTSLHLSIKINKEKFYCGTVKSRSLFRPRFWSVQIVLLWPTKSLIQCSNTEKESFFITLQKTTVNRKMKRSTSGWCRFLPEVSSQ